MLPLGLDPLVHPTASVRESRLGRCTEVGARTSVIESELGDYSYVVNDSDIIYTRIGKFCSIAAQTRINPGNHPMHRTSQSHFTYRSSRYFPGESDEAAFFDWRRSQPVDIGHDVWIGHGATCSRDERSVQVPSWQPVRSSARTFRTTASWPEYRHAWCAVASSPVSQSGCCGCAGGIGTTNVCTRRSGISECCPWRHF
jgi:hypothetical protein